MGMEKKGWGMQRTSGPFFYNNSTLLCVTLQGVYFYYNQKFPYEHVKIKRVEREEIGKGRGKEIVWEKSKRGEREKKPSFSLLSSLLFLLFLSPSPPPLLVLFYRKVVKLLSYDSNYFFK
jgi:hypothetical protein